MGLGDPKNVRGNCENSLPTVSVEDEESEQHAQHFQNLLIVEPQFRVWN
jgi:hypothetical protein